MSSDIAVNASKLIPETYVAQGLHSIKKTEDKFYLLLQQCKIPEDGWTDLEITKVLHDIALMDSNNFSRNAGMGEREARIYSHIVANRHFGFGHGIGRSGDLIEVQPKAAGSSLINKLTNKMLLDLIRQLGVRSCTSCFLVPMATGMTLTLAMLALRHQRLQAKYVIWSRIDQKSCFKCILAAGFEPVIIEPVLQGDELHTNLDEISKKIFELGSDSILCVLTTTSCFAPRIPDKIVDIAILCKEHNIPHLINNAYGLQLPRCMNMIEEAARKGRVDAFVQSTDKNLMVPVGGAVIAGFDSNFINLVSSSYPGRASGTPTLDVFITLLSMGLKGYRRLVSERRDLFDYFQKKFSELAVSHNERLLVTPKNHISLGITLTVAGHCPEDASRELTKLGSMLFIRQVSGTRVITATECKMINGYSFAGFGAHFNTYPSAYLTAAVAIGTTKQEIDTFCERLDRALVEWRKKTAPMKTCLDRKMEELEIDSDDATRELVKLNFREQI